MDKNSRYIAADIEDRWVLCEILFRFLSDETGKEYVVFTDHKTDDDGNENIYASYIEYLEEDEEELVPVEDDEELEIIERLFVELQKSLQEKREKKRIKD